MRRCAAFNVRAVCWQLTTTLVYRFKVRLLRLVCVVSVRFCVCGSFGGGFRQLSGTGWCAPRVVCHPEPKSAMFSVVKVFSAVWSSGFLGTPAQWTCWDYYVGSLRGKPFTYFPCAFGDTARLASHKVS